MSTVGCDTKAKSHPPKIRPHKNTVKPLSIIGLCFIVSPSGHSHVVMACYMGVSIIKGSIHQMCLDDIAVALYLFSPLLSELHPALKGPLLCSYLGSVHRTPHTELLLYQPQFLIPTKRKAKQMLLERSPRVEFSAQMIPLMSLATCPQEGLHCLQFRRGNRLKGLVKDLI